MFTLTRCQVSGVRCQVSGVSCQMSGVRCQVSGVVMWHFAVALSPQHISKQYTDNCVTYPYQHFSCSPTLLRPIPIFVCHFVLPILERRKFVQLPLLCYVQRDLYLLWVILCIFGWLDWETFHTRRSKSTCLVYFSSGVSLQASRHVTLHCEQGKGL